MENTKIETVYNDIRQIVSLIEQVREEHREGLSSEVKTILRNCCVIGRETLNNFEKEKVNVKNKYTPTPELLEALKDLVKANSTRMGRSALQLRMDLAIEAINKAEGK